jgi:N-ethylmaleimide reductase
MKLFEPYSLGNLRLQNRCVMAPMTRSRAIGNIPNDLMAQYYGQRSSAGLIITEGVAPSPNGLGYARIPGAFSPAQTEGWKKITAAAHQGGAKIFMQLMHTGRVTQRSICRRRRSDRRVGGRGADVDRSIGMQPLPTPRALETREIAGVINEYAQSSKNAVAAGFDGIELHGANGYLIEQFLNAGTNKRTDGYGGSIEKRNRFAVETAAAVAKAIGPEKTGIRLSPFNNFNDMPEFEEAAEQYQALG